MKKNDVNAVLSCPLFGNASEELIKELLSSGNYEIISVSRGETVFSEGERNVRLCLVLKGSLEVSKGNIFMSSLKEGAMSGMSCLFSEESAFPTTVRAAENSRLLFITKEQLMSLFGRYPDILEKYLSLLSRKICFLSGKIESISAPDSSEALRNYLTDYGEKLGTDTFTLPLSGSRLASTLGMGRTSLYRAFERLTEEGFMTKNGKTVTIERK